ncbi:SAM-dependent methyltransferase [Ralstonia syzygii]|uniref:class I SAM-dependent methyltransferase n=1 Tax=Ralstonia syzygii TaxID=28097 RepID=UPI0018D1B0BF|nr:class I SAM-dependent methyltransferase [Ralstonia syzygii]
MAASTHRLMNAWRRGGPALALGVVLDRLIDAVLERRLRIRSGGLVPIESLLAHWGGCHDYYPSSIRAFNRVLRDLDVTGDDVFVDYGSGMGRAIVLASRFPFREVIGVEASARLHGTAQANVGRTIPATERARVHLVHCNARCFRLPDTASVLYFYNPFHGDILRTVFADIEQSLRLRPRRLRIVFNNPAHFRLIELDYRWLRRAREYPFEYPIVVYEATSASTFSGA